MKQKVTLSVEIKYQNIELADIQFKEFFKYMSVTRNIEQLMILTYTA